MSAAGSNMIEALGLDPYILGSVLGVNRPICRSLTELIYQYHEMLETSPVAGAFERKYSHLQLPKMQIFESSKSKGDEHEEGREQPSGSSSSSSIPKDTKEEDEDELLVPSALQQYVIDSQIKPFAKRILLWFAVMGACPFYLEKIKITDDEYVLVPIAYDHRQIAVDIEKDGRTGREKIVYKDRKTNKPVKFVVYSTMCEGPSTTRVHIDSECAMIYPEWKRYQELRQIELDVIRREAYPLVYITKQTPMMTQPNEVGDQEIQDMMQDLVVDENGLFHANPNGESLRLTTGEGFVALPKQHITTAAQPRPVCLVNAQSAFFSLMTNISMVLKLPPSALGLTDAGGGGGGGGEGVHFHHKTVGEVDNDRESVIETLDKTVKDLELALREVWYIMYKSQIKKIHIPIRSPFLDAETLHKATEEYKVLRPEQSKRLILKSLGLDEHQLAREDEEHRKLNAKKKKKKTKTKTKTKSKQEPTTKSPDKDTPKRQKVSSDSDSSSSDSSSVSSTSSSSSEEEKTKKKKKKKKVSSKSKKRPRKHTDDDEEEKPKKKKKTTEKSKKKKKKGEEQEKKSDDADDKSVKR